MPYPKCPVCNSPTRLQTVKGGDNVPSQIYLCTRFPMCNGTVHITGNTQSPTSQGNSSITAIRISLPRFFVARQRFERLQVRFFQTVAVSIPVLECFIEGNLSDQALRAFSQWRLDFPMPSETPNLNDRQIQAISVAEKILTRGRITLCSPKLESLFTKQFIDTDFTAKISDKMLFLPFKLIDYDYWLDSESEQIFYKDYLPNKFGIDFLHWVTPQVELSSLLSANTSIQISGRVDFLICHPSKHPTIVEVDGKQHLQQPEIDKFRDEALVKEGYRVLRIPVSELENLSGPNLSILEEIYSPVQNEMDKSYVDNERLVRYIHTIKVAHQIQLSVLQAVKSGFLQFSDPSSWNISIDFNETNWLNDNDSLFVFKSAIEDLLELLRNIAQLYSIEISGNNPNLSLGSGKSGIHLSFTGKAHQFLPTFFVQNISLPFDIANTIFPSSSATLDMPKVETLEFFLNYIFRKPYFWEGQFDAISRTLQGKDSIVLLPTGAGKSIAFQLASLLLPGCAVVIAPIISLMEDQIDNLQMVGMDRTIAITSQISDPEVRSKVLTLFGKGEYLFAYVAPERFQTVEFREAISRLTTHIPISLIAVDEAHCVSEWGHDFRTAYLNIGKTSRTYCKSNASIPPLLALTGTASRAVLKDVQRELQIEDFEAIITPKSFDRPELKFYILSSKSSEKRARLIGYLESLPSLFGVTKEKFFQSNGKNTFAGLIFCPHVNGEYGVVNVADKIRKELSIQVGIYAGQTPKLWKEQTWEKYKKNITKQFKHNQIPLLVCTKAFGMGIDKPNIRYTVHFGIPPSIESFYQEAGRAGRDRNFSRCCIIVSVDYVDRARRLLDPNTKPEEISEILKGLKRDDNDDVTRAIYFQINAFPGIEEEKKRVGQVISALKDLSTKSTKSIKLPNLEREAVEKALHRLNVIGVVSDYTINYSTNEFTVILTGATKESIIESYTEYVASYLEARRTVELEKSKRLLNLSFDEFVLKMIELLLHFIYDVIEQGRRRALYEMFLAATQSSNDEEIRQRILRYFESTQYSEALDNILSDAVTWLKKTIETFETVRSPNESAELRGQVARYLESYPDHPGLLMLRSLAEVYSRDRNATIVKQNFLASISSYEEKYVVKEDELFEFAAWGIHKITDRDLQLAQDLLKDMLYKYPKPSFARKLVEQTPLELAYIPACFLIWELIESSKKLLL